MSGGGDSGGGTTISKTEPPAYVQPYAEQLMNQSAGLAQTPYNPYSGAQVAPMTADHETGIDMVRQRATEGSPWLRSMGAVTQDALGGSPTFMSGQASARTQTADNPYIAVNSPNASNSYIGQTTQGISGAPSVMQHAQQAQMNNPYLGQQTNSIAGPGAVTAQRNGMMGQDNPYLNSAISQAQGETARQYNQTVAPQREAQMRSSGSFGNTGVQQMQNEDQRNLQNSLGGIANNMRMQDYNLQAQLGEADAARNLQAQQVNASNQMGTQQFNAGLQGSDLARNLAGFQQQGQFNFGNLLNAAQFDAGNSLNTQQFNAGLSAADLSRNSSQLQNMSQFNVGNQVQDVRQMQNLAQQQGQFNAGQGNSMAQFNTNLASQRQGNAMGYGQYFADQPYSDAQRMLGIGDINRDYMQTLLNQGQQNWTEAQNQPYRGLDLLANGVRTSMGGGGTNTQSSTLPRINPASQMLGGGMGGAALGSMIGDGAGGNYGGWGAALGAGAGLLA